LSDPVEDDRTDWLYLNNLTDEANEANIASDFDAWPLADQARGCFFHVHRSKRGGWSWDMVDPAGQVIARAASDFATQGDAEAAAERVKGMLAAA